MKSVAGLSKGNWCVRESPTVSFMSQRLWIPDGGDLPSTAPVAAHLLAFPTPLDTFEALPHCVPPEAPVMSVRFETGVRDGRMLSEEGGETG